MSDAQPRGTYQEFSGAIIRRFQLKDALTKGSYAESYPYIYRAGSLTVVTSNVFRVYDPINTFSGAIGKRGLCVWMEDAQRWEIIQMECP